MPLTAADIARELDGEVRGDGSVVLTGFAPATTAKPGDLTFAENETYFKKAEQSAATGILIDGDFASDAKVIVKVPNARIAFAKVLPLFFPEPRPPAGIHPSAVVAGTAVVDSSAHVGQVARHRLVFGGQGKCLLRGAAEESKYRLMAVPGGVADESGDLFPEDG
jgi:UDP-3-O-[3-hydroxymyristoyl] glucosamine N-acyltransferase